MADYVYPELLNKYEFRNYGHALEILSEVFPKEWKEIQECLAKFVITEDDLLVAGGNESQIPKKFDDILYPYGWKEIKISGDLEVKLYQRLNKKSKSFVVCHCAYHLCCDNIRCRYADKDISALHSSLEVSMDLFFVCLFCNFFLCRVHPLFSRCRDSLAFNHNNITDSKFQKEFTDRNTCRSGTIDDYPGL